MMSAARVDRCYTVCPPEVQSNGPDPFYDTAYHILDQEMHSGIEDANGAVLPGRLTQVAGDIEHPIAGYWPDARRRVRVHSKRFMPHHVWGAPPTHGKSPYSPSFTPTLHSRPPFTPSVMLQLRAKHYAAAAHHLGQDPNQNPNLAPAHHLTAHHKPGTYAAPKKIPPPQYHNFPVLRAESKPVEPNRKKSECLTVCPKNDKPFKGDEVLGGPFGPDPQKQREYLSARHSFGGLTPIHHAARDRGGIFGPDPLQIPGHFRPNVAQISRHTAFGFGPA